MPNDKPTAEQKKQLTQAEVTKHLLFLTGGVLTEDWLRKCKANYVMQAEQLKEQTSDEPIEVREARIKIIQATADRFDALLRFKSDLHRTQTMLDEAEVALKKHGK